MVSEELYTTSIFAPLTGKVVDLSDVNDAVYAARLLGDGVAIVPEEGTLFSPVTGTLNSISDDSDMFTFTSDTGLEIVIHVGVMGTVGEGCRAVHKNVNARVQAGDLIAEFDLEKIGTDSESLVTPVIICGGLEGKIIHPAAGHVLAGAGEIMRVVDEEAKARYEAEEKEREEQAKREEEEKNSPKAQLMEKVNAVKLQNESDVMDFLHDKSNWPKLIIGFLLITALFVAVLLGVAMFIGH